jgi:heme exporter protein A
VNQPSAAAIRFDRVDKRYGGIYALKRVSLEIAPGECVLLAGRNGSGKTTLLRIAARLVRPTAGEVQVGEKGPLAGTTGYVAHASMVYDELSAEENLVLFAKLLGVQEPSRRAAALLEEVGLAGRRGSLLRTLSRGMRQRVAIARALLSEPALLLLDEPATGLDPASTAWLTAKLRQLHDAGCTILMSLHGESVIAALATRGMRLEAGSIVADTRDGVSRSAILAFADA